MDPTIYIVDDDAGMRDSLALLLGLKGFRTQMFASGETLLTAFKPEWFGCLLVDIRMPGMDGLELFEQLRQLNCDVPVVFITAFGDVSTVRAALKAGATDFLEKPVDVDILIDVLHSAFKSHEEHRVRASRASEPRSSSKLTAREQQVMALAEGGLAAREIADKLGISPRTVEVYKARLAQKVRRPRTHE